MPYGMLANSVTASSGLSKRLSSFPMIDLTAWSSSFPEWAARSGSFLDLRGILGGPKYQHLGIGLSFDHV
jgi:hypothetical protein